MRARSPLGAAGVARGLDRVVDPQQRRSGLGGAGDRSAFYRERLEDSGLEGVDRLAGADVEAGRRQLPAGRSKLRDGRDGVAAGVPRQDPRYRLERVGDRLDRQLGAVGYRRGVRPERVGDAELGRTRARHGASFLERGRQHAQTVVGDPLELVGDVLGPRDQEQREWPVVRTAPDHGDLAATERPPFEDVRPTDRRRGELVDPGDGRRAGGALETVELVAAGPLDREHAATGEQMPDRIVDRLLTEDDVGAGVGDPLGVSLVRLALVRPELLERIGRVELHRPHPRGGVDGQSAVDEGDRRVLDPPGERFGPDDRRRGLAEVDHQPVDQLGVTDRSARVPLPDDASVPGPSRLHGRPHGPDCEVGEERGRVVVPSTGDRRSGDRLEQVGVVDRNGDRPRLERLGRPLDGEAVARGDRRRVEAILAQRLALGEQLA